MIAHITSTTISVYRFWVMILAVGLRDTHMALDRQRSDDLLRVYSIVSRGTYAALFVFQNPNQFDKLFYLGSLLWYICSKGDY